MDKVDFLKELKKFTLDVTKDLLLPVIQQRHDVTDPPRCPNVFLQRIPSNRTGNFSEPNFADFELKVPYVLHQIMESDDSQSQGQREESSVVVRSIFAVYNEDEQEGGLELLNLCERVRIGLLKERIVGKKYALDLEKGLQWSYYPDDVAPYYGAEMYSSWKMPIVRQEVDLIGDWKV